MPDTPDDISLSISGRHQRRLSAIMFTDIKGFSSMMETDEVTAVGLVKAQREIIRKQIALHSGEERETIGDAFLVIFDSAVNAVQCAIEIQREIWDYNQTREPDKQVWVRIGIHLGDILVEEGSVFGEGVNLAARVEPLAEPGGICITRPVYDQVRHHLEISVTHLEVRDLKNITDIPDIYRIRVATTAPREPITLKERLRWFAYSPLRIGITIAVVLFAVSLNIYWTFFAEHTSFARQVVYSLTGPRPIREITKKESEDLDHFYKLTRKGAHVVRLEEVKRPTQKPEDLRKAWQFGLTKRPKGELPVHEYAYDAGKLREESVFDNFGVLQYKLLFDEDAKVATAHDSSGYIETFENQIAGFGFEYDDKGRVVKIENRNAFGMLKNDAQGAASYRFVYNTDNLPVEISTYDAYGNSVEDKDGIAVKQFTYDKDGLAVKEIYLDRYRAEREAINGVAMIEREFDSGKRPVLEKYMDRQGAPAMDNEGACLKKFTYDSRGRLKETASLSCAGNPRATKAGYASRVFEYEGERVSKENYLDEKGMLTSDSRGVASVYFTYDNQGRVSGTSFFGPDGAETINEDRAHTVRYEYTNAGLPAKRSYLDAGGKPTIAAGGYTEVRIQYNERGDATEWAYFDTEGNLANNREGYAFVRNEYDQFGNTTSKAFFDKSNEPSLGKEEICHRIQIKYDDRGELAETRCFDGQGKLTPGIKNCAISSFQRDAYGKPTHFECYIADGKLIDVPNLPSMLDVKYDKRGYTSEVRAYDANGSLAERFQGAAIWKRVSDDYGNQLEISTYDRNEHLIDNPKYRAAIFRREFDNRGNEMVVKAFDQDGNPSKGIWGFAEVRYERDKFGHKTSTAYFDEESKPAVNWQGVHRYKITYDDRGRQSEIANLGQSGEPILNSDGVAFTRYGYDQWGQVAKIEYLDTGQKPAVNRRLNCASQNFSIDGRGNVFEVRCLGTDGEFCTEDECIAITSQEFDAKGRMTKQLFKTADGGADTDENGANGYRDEYDIEGRISVQHVLGPGGNENADRDGINDYHLNYNSVTGALWYITFADEKENRMRSRDGADLRIFLYDPVFLERRRAIVDATQSGQITTIKCLNEAGDITEDKTCAIPAEVKAEADKIRAVMTE